MKIRRLPYFKHLSRVLPFLEVNLAKLQKANKERACSLMIYPAASPQTYSTKPYIRRGKSFRKGGSSYRRGDRDIDQDRTAPLATTTKPSKFGDGQATMTFTVPWDSNKRKFQRNEGTLVPNVNVEPGGLRNSQKQSE